MDYEREIPFGVFDSELMHQEISIPDGFTATIEGDKIILTRTESEDEKIRKAIHIYLDWLDGRKDYAPRGEYTIRDMIAWLEKQGESTDINPSEFDLRLNKLLKQFETLSKEELTSSLSFYLNVIQNDGTYREEKQGEQKPTDKVEPKFHKGGWVVDNAGYIWKIKGILNKFYILEGVEGDESRPTTEWADDTFHLWTIKDAKDGDVLAYNDGSLTIFHYRLSGLDAGLYMSHVLLIDKIELKQTCAINNVHPATKEQRDQLEKAMADAGYTFDFDKKELKKIEQKSTEWSEEDESILQGIWDEILVNKHNSKEYEWKAYDKFLDWLKSIKGRVQPKQEWSEEDEVKLKSACALIRNTSINGNEGIEDFTINWLKSLKGRIQTKQGWKPSNEQMESLFALLPTICSSNPIFSLYEDLKKLKG